MSFFKKCPKCRKRKLYICKRKYKTKAMGVITSNDEICKTCYKSLKKLVKII